MNMKLTSRIHILSLAAGASLLVCVFMGCGSQTAPSQTSPALLSAEGAISNAVPAKGRAQIWSETCNRCHNTRSPDSYSGNEWAIVMTHMRVRGYLTGEDQRAILEFLQQQ